MSNTLAEISKIQEQIAALRGAALDELKNRRASLQEQLRDVDRQIAALTGKPVRRGKAAAPEGDVVKHVPASEGKKPGLQALKTRLSEAPNKTISLRKESYDVRNVRIMAEANPHLLKMGGKGAWPEVTLLK
jgi:hypothetical protein